MDTAIKTYDAEVLEFPQVGNRTPNKRSGIKSEVYPYQIADLKKMLAYFRDKDMWIHYLLLTMSCNMARRVSDMLELRWYQIYNPATGRFRQDAEFKEKKTGKLASVHMNSAVKDAIDEYIAHTGINYRCDNYSSYVFIQTSGTHTGSQLTSSGHLKALKKAAAAVGIEYNIGTHSARKTYGMLTKQIHPNDPFCMSVLMEQFNHSSEAMTNKYIGLTKKREDRYYEDLGDFFKDYVVGEKKYQDDQDTNIVSLDYNDLLSLLERAYTTGMNNSHDIDPMTHTAALKNFAVEIQQMRK